MRHIEDCSVVEEKLTTMSEKFQEGFEKNTEKMVEAQKERFAEMDKRQSDLRHDQFRHHVFARREHLRRGHPPLETYTQKSTQKILELIAEPPKVTTQEMADSLGIMRWAVAKHIKIF